MTLIANPKRVTEKNKRESRSAKRNTMSYTTTADVYLKRMVTITAVVKALQHVSPTRDRAVLDH